MFSYKAKLCERASGKKPRRFVSIPRVAVEIYELKHGDIITVTMQRNKDRRYGNKVTRSVSGNMIKLYDPSEPLIEFESDVRIYGNRSEFFVPYPVLKKHDMINDKSVIVVSLEIHND